MNENEQVLETFIKQQQEMISDLSQNNIMLKTKVEFLEKKLLEFDTFEKNILDLKRDKLRLQRKIDTLTNTNKTLNDRIRNGKDENKELRHILEQKKLINKTTISGFSHTGKIQR
jgi:predicted RNase H-like nuclease (RuvC/YqgF family)